MECVDDDDDNYNDNDDNDNTSTLFIVFAFLNKSNAFHNSLCFICSFVSSFVEQIFT